MFCSLHFSLDDKKKKTNKQTQARRTWLVHNLREKLNLHFNLNVLLFSLPVHFLNLTKL